MPEQVSAERIRIYITVHLVLRLLGAYWPPSLHTSAFYGRSSHLKRLRSAINSRSVAVNIFFCCCCCGDFGPRTVHRLLRWPPAALYTFVAKHACPTMPAKSVVLASPLAGTELPEGARMRRSSRPLCQHLARSGTLQAACVCRILCVP